MRTTAEVGPDQVTTRRVAEQIGCGVESLRTWVKRADIDEGVEPRADHDETDASASSSRRSATAPRERSLKRASSFFAAVLDRPSR